MSTQDCARSYLELTHKLAEKVKPGKAEYSLELNNVTYIENISQC